jgi:SHS2 domain-containing protein
LSVRNPLACDQWRDAKRVHMGSMTAQDRSPGSDATAPRWEHFEHGADIGVRGIAASKAGAFEQAALAMTAVITDPAGVRLQDAVDIECEAPDDELLLAHWLNAVVTQMATRHLLFGHFEVRLEGTRLHARASGEPVVPRRHHPAVEVKGATCTALRVAQAADGRWIAQTVVDV